LLCRAIPKRHASALRRIWDKGDNANRIRQKGRWQIHPILSPRLSRGSHIHDDLLLWDRRKNRFICLGLPLRMRRPLPKLDTDLGQRFIAGKSIAYSRRDAFDIAPAGFAFFPDEIVELTPTPAPVPLTQLLARIKAFSISKSLTNFHSETLEGQIQCAFFASFELYTVGLGC
jgi:hypothetical protein